MKAIDGPAKGVYLQARRAPLMLRVVHNKVTDVWDVLDQLEDSPSADEEIFIYRVVRGCTISRGFWDGRDKNTGRRTGGSFEHADYELSPIQPDHELRTNEEWLKWIDENKDVLCEGFNVEKKVVTNG